MTKERELLENAQLKSELIESNVKFKPFLFSPQPDVYQIETREFEDEVLDISWSVYLSLWINKLNKTGKKYRVIKEQSQRQNYHGWFYSIVEILEEDNETEDTTV